MITEREEMNGLNDYYEKKAKNSEELAILWFWVCAVGGALLFVGVIVVKWIIALITAL